MLALVSCAQFFFFLVLLFTFCRSFCVCLLVQYVCVFHWESYLSWSIWDTKWECMPVLEIALRDAAAEPSGLLIKVIILEGSSGLPFVTSPYIYICNKQLSCIFTKKVTVDASFFAIFRLGLGSTIAMFTVPLYLLLSALYLSFPFLLVKVVVRADPSSLTSSSQHLEWTNEMRRDQL